MAIQLLSTGALIRFIMNGATFTTTKAMKVAVCVEPNALYAGGKYKLNNQAKAELTKLIGV